MYCFICYLYLFSFILLDKKIFILYVGEVSKLFCCILVEYCVSLQQNSCLLIANCCDESVTFLYDLL